MATEWQSFDALRVSDRRNRLGTGHVAKEAKHIERSIDRCAQRSDSVEGVASTDAIDNTRG